MTLTALLDALVERVRYTCRVIEMNVDGEDDDAVSDAVRREEQARRAVEAFVEQLTENK